LSAMRLDVVPIAGPERLTHKALHCGHKHQQRSHTWSLFYCLFAPLACRCYSSRAHRVRSALHMRRHADRGLQRHPFIFTTNRIECRFFCEGCIWHWLHILVTAPFCCDRRARAANAKTLTL